MSVQTDEVGSASILLASAGMLPAPLPATESRRTLVARTSVNLGLSGIMPDSAGNMPAVPISYERIALG